MPESLPCGKLGNCLQFQDFLPSSSSDKLYVNTAQSVAVTCPAGTNVTVPIPAGVVGYVLKFQIGSAPYPDISLNCTGGMISIPVPDTITQPQLDDLIMGMLNQCVQQIATNIGCQPGTFFNTQQSLNPCTGNENLVNSSSVLGSGASGALPAGVYINSDCSLLIMVPGTIQSTVSTADANSKAQQVLAEIFSTGNAQCADGCGGS